MRAGLLAGPVTYGNLFTMQPFQDDYVDTFTLTGAQVWALLHQQLATGTGGIMQISGLHFSYTGSQGSGSITGVWLGAAGDDTTPIADSDASTYTGTANSFMMGGGDGFTVLESAGEHRADYPTPNWYHWSTTLPACPTRSPTPPTAGSPKPDRPRHRDRYCRVVPPSAHALTPAERSASDARSSVRIPRLPATPLRSWSRCLRCRRRWWVWCGARVAP